MKTNENSELPFIVLKRNELEAMLSSVIRNELVNLKLNEKPQNNDQQRYLTRAEICQLLKISNTTLHRYVNDGTLMPVRIGRSVRFLYSDIEDIINGKSRRKA